MVKEVDYNSLRERLNGIKSESRKTNSSYNPVKEEKPKSNYQIIRESLERRDLGGRSTNEYMLRYLKNLNEVFNKGDFKNAEIMTMNIYQVLTSSPNMDKEIKLKHLEALNRRIDRGLKKLERIPGSNRTFKEMEKILDYSKMLEEDIKGHSSSLEKTLGIVSAASVMAGIFLLSPNLTGNVVGTFTRGTSNIFGGLLFALGLLGTFVIIRK